MTFRALLAALWLAASALPAPAALAAEPARVAVLPLVIHSLEDGGYLRDGIAEMLSTRLNQRGLAVQRVSDAGKATEDLEAARAAGRAAGADWVLFGSFTRFGEGASLDLRCVPVDSTGGASARSVFVQAGGLSDVIPRLDSVVERIATHVHGGPSAAVAAATDPSAGVDVAAELAALRQRIEALEARKPPEQANAAASEAAKN